MSDFGDFLSQGLNELQAANAGQMAMDAPPIEAPQASAPTVEAPQPSFEAAVASAAVEMSPPSMEMER